MFPILSCQSISKSFGAHALFTGISISFHDDERMGLIGPNGSGKSTLLRILAGLEKVDEGEVTSRKEIRLAYIPQQDQLSPEETVESTLLNCLADEPIEDVERYNRARRWIGRAGFVDAGQRVAELSGGWRKRLSIISALITEPGCSYWMSPLTIWIWKESSGWKNFSVIRPSLLSWLLMIGISWRR